MTDFESTERRTMNGNTDPAAITFHNKPITRRLPDGQPLDEKAWRNWWLATFHNRVEYLARDADHSFDRLFDPPTNPTRAQVVEVYEAAYSELVELLKETAKEVERARAEARSLRSDREWLKSEVEELVVDRDRWMNRFEALIKVVTAATKREDPEGMDE